MVRRLTVLTLSLVAAVAGVLVLASPRAASPAPISIRQSEATATALPGAGAMLALRTVPLAPADGSTSDWYGACTALSGDTAIVGSPHSAVNDLVKAGAVYVFVDSDGVWTQQAELTAPDAAAKDSFGSAIALDGDTAVIGAPNKTFAGKEQAGVTYVFTRSGTTWSKQAEIADPAGKDYDAFGGTVALQGDTALIAGWGTGDYDQEQQMTSKAYVFTRTGSTWTEQRRLKDPDAGDTDEFGYSLALDGDTALVGAELDEDLGAAYFYSRSGGLWPLRQSLEEPNMTSNEASFGSAVALSGDTAVITDTDLIGGGVANVYRLEKGKWRFRQTLRDASYGWSAAVSGGTMVIGGGRASYVYTRSAKRWIFNGKLLEPAAATGHSFGALALAGTTAIVGDPGDTDGKDVVYGTAWAAHVGAMPRTSLKAAPASILTGQAVKLTGHVTNPVAGQKTVAIYRQLKHHKLALLKKVTLRSDESYAWTLHPRRSGSWSLFATYTAAGIMSPSPVRTLSVR